jgi:transcription termination factor Rho
MENSRSGILEITDKGFGFLRNPEANFVPQPDDLYVSARIINDFYLREGCHLVGEAGELRGTAQNAPLTRLLQVNNCPAEGFKDVSEIRDRTAIDPEEKFQIECGHDDAIGRAIDIFCPIGKGQRGLIVAPPKVGKTTALKHIAHAIARNHPATKVYAVLIDERPEEVTDFQRSTGCRVFYSSLDERPEKHMRVARLAFSTALLEAEMGFDVVVLIDSLTRMTRAFNLRNTNQNNRGKGNFHQQGNSGGANKMLSGGIDAEALAMPKRFFGAARNFRGQGSLSVLASILVDTGSRMDEVIFQEYKGTGNMELVLNRTIAERNIFPAISILESGTRKEEKLLGKDNAIIANIRRKLGDYRDVEALAEILGAFRKTSSNRELFDRIAGSKK